MKYFKYIVMISFVIFFSCDDGVSPESKPTGFRGTITFLGEWPDSIAQTRIVLFKNPLNRLDDFNAENLKFASEPIPSGVSSYNYNTTEIAEFGSVTAGEYSYLAVAQSTSEVLLLTRSAWVVAGVYYANSNTSSPGELSIPENTVLEGIDIVCDFDNPPPQPPSK
jgi:hypothetical protein